jgi:hypothetical protein
MIVLTCIPRPDKASARYFIMAFVALGLTTNVYAQKVVEYDNTTLKPFLPYQQAFFVEGNRSFLTEKTTAGEVFITKLPPDENSQTWKKQAYENSKGSTEADKYYWWEIDPAASKYKFHITRPLSYGVKYRFDFKFYTKVKYSDELKSLIEREAHALLLDKAMKSQFLTVTEVKDKINAVITDITTKKELKSLKIEKGVIQATLATAAITENKAEIIQQYIFLEAMIKNIETFQTQGKALVNSQRANWPAVEAAVKAGIAANPTIAADVNLLELTNFITAYKPLSPASTWKLRALAAKLPAIVGGQLGVLLSYSESMQTYEEQIKGYTKEKADFDKDYKGAYDALLDNMYAVLSETASVQTSSVTIDEKTIDKTRWSVVIGTGPSWTGPVKDFNFQANPIAYVAFKYYLFSPVDKEVENQFLKDVPGKRLSIIAGWRVAGDLRYRGMEMKPVLGIKPIAGFSCDFARSFSVDVYCTMYTQADKNPFINGVKLKAAPGIGLSIDLDLVNRLKALLSGTGYALPTNK